MKILLNLALSDDKKGQEILFSMAIFVFANTFIDSLIYDTCIKKGNMKRPIFHIGHRWISPTFFFLILWGGITFL